MAQPQERDQNNNVIDEYTWGLGLPGGIGGLLHLHQGGAHYSYLYDGKGNVTALLDANATVAAAYQYDPFGKVRNVTGSVNQPFQFSTKPYDDKTGLSYYGYRFYVPALGRWLTRDPLGEAGGINLYGFVFNSPINFIDLWGLKPYKCYKNKKDMMNDAANEAKPETMKWNVEWGGSLYQNPDGTWSYTAPRTDWSSETVDPYMPIPDGATRAGDYHTHGAESGYENFSRQDINSINDMNALYPGYEGALLTPSGATKTYSPGAGVSTLP